MLTIVLPADHRTTVGIQSLIFNLANLRSILCIGAHPDDIEIGCGGTLLELASQHADLRIDWAVFGCDPTRAMEAKSSFQTWFPNVTLHTLHTYSFPDTLFPASYAEIKKQIHLLSTQTSPDLIFTHRREDLHQDHRVLAELTWNAFRRHFILEYEIPKYEGDLGQPNVFFPLRIETANAKVEHLMKSFPSQAEKPWFDPETFQAIMRIRGLESRSESGYAEAFHGRKILLRP